MGGGGGGGLPDFIVISGPFRFIWILELIRTWLGLGLGYLGTGGLGPGLDN